MVRLLEKSVRGGRDRSPRRMVVASVACEGLEERQLLSGGAGFAGSGFSPMGRGFGSIAAERGTFQSARQDGMFGGGAVGLGGAAKNPLLFLTAPIVDGSSTTPPSPAVFSNSSVQSAVQTLQTDLENDIPSGAKPTHASIGQLQDDLDSIRKGTLTGTAATTAIQNDQAAILKSMGLTPTQITQIQSDQAAVQTAIQTASASTSTATSSSSSSSSTSMAPPATPPGMSSAVQTAMQTLQSDLSTDTPSGAKPTHESIGQVEDDLDAIRNGTLTGSAAVTQVETDTAAVLSSEGLTQTQITQIQADQAAVATAIEANQPASTSSTSTSSTSTSSTSTQSATWTTLQSVTPYLSGLPGLGGFGRGGMGAPGGIGGHDGGFPGGDMGPMGGF